MSHCGYKFDNNSCKGDLLEYDYFFTITFTDEGL